MKKLQTLLLVSILLLAYSCSDDNPVDKTEPDPKIEGIELIAAQGTEIKKLSDDSQATFHTQIKNIGDEDIDVIASMEIIELGSGMTSYFCWGDLAKGDGLCYPPSTVDFSASFTLKVKAGETTPEANFINYVDNTSNFGGVAKIRYIVYEEDNRPNADTIVYNVTFGGL